MENVLVDLVKFVGVPSLIIIISFMILYKYGDKFIDFFKTIINKKDIEDRYETLVHNIREDSQRDKERLFNLVQKAEEREKIYNKTIEDTNNINKELAANNKELAENNRALVLTNKELYNKMGVEITKVKQNQDEFKEALDKVQSNVLEIKIRTENNNK